MHTQITRHLYITYGLIARFIWSTKFQQKFIFVHFSILVSTYADATLECAAKFLKNCNAKKYMSLNFSIRKKPS